MRSMEEDVFQQIMEYPRARVTFDRLVNHGADPRLLQNLLLLHIIFAEPSAGRRGLPARRLIERVRALTGYLSCLMRDIARFPEISTAISEGGSPTNAQRRTALPDPDQMSEALAGYHRVMDEISSRPRSRNQGGRRNRSVCFLADYIRYSTGRYHYEDLVLLLNAAGNVVTASGRNWDSNALTQFFHRERRRPNYRAPFESWFPVTI